MSEFTAGVLCGMCFGAVLVFGLFYLADLLWPLLPDPKKEP